MNPINYTPTQWLNVAAFALASLATGGWWTDMLDPKVTAFVTGGITYVVTVLNFMLSGKPPAS